MLAADILQQIVETMRHGDWCFEHDGADAPVAFVESVSPTQALVHVYTNPTDPNGELVVRRVRLSLEELPD